MTWGGRKVGVRLPFRHCLPNPALQSFIVSALGWFLKSVSARMACSPRRKGESSSVKIPCASPPPSPPSPHQACRWVLLVPKLESSWAILKHSSSVLFCFYVAYLIFFSVCVSPSPPSPHNGLVHVPFHVRKTIVRGNKTSKDGSLAWLLDEFENMSVSRSNSLRRDSPPFPARHDRFYQENGLGEALGRPRHHLPQHPPHAEDDGGGSKSREPKERNRHGPRNDVDPSRERTASPLSRGHEPPHKPHQQSGHPRPPEHPKPRAPERDKKREPPAERVVKRERTEGPDKRPKSTYTGEVSPQPPREKRPLSGPNMRTPNIPVSEGVMKTAQQTGRPFNTYPRADTDLVRGTQVKPLGALVGLASPDRSSGGAVHVTSEFVHTCKGHVLPPA